MADSQVRVAGAATARAPGRRGRTLRGGGAFALVVAAALLVTSATACQPGLPAAPAPPTVVPGNSYVLVRWSGASASSSPITGFVVTLVLDDGGRVQRSASTGSLSTVFNGLRNGTGVRFTLRARSARGLGPPSAMTRRVVVGGPGSDPLRLRASWLEVVNYYRRASGLAPVTANPAWVAGLVAHLNYLERTPWSMRTGLYANAHQENPASPWYTAAGEEAGRSSNLGGDAGSDRENISGWLSAPFHAIGILRPSLTQSAYAASAGRSGLDVIRGIGPSPNAAPPVLFPGPGAITTITSFRGESPDPLESCRGYAAPAGLPLVALLPEPPPSGTSATLKPPTGPTLTPGASLCVVTADTYRSSDAVYGETGRAILSGENAVLIIPRRPLVPGTYQARLTLPGKSALTWSFTVIG